jgi:hypothetical protein
VFPFSWKRDGVYRWQNEFFENGTAAVEQKVRPHHSTEQEAEQPHRLHHAEGHARRLEQEIKPCGIGI